MIYRGDQTTSIKNLQKKFIKKYDEALSHIEALKSEVTYQSNTEDLTNALKKAALYQLAIEELNFKEKLILKRALTLCLILLKQCRANVKDENLVEICTTLISPALKTVDDYDY